jgi:hypothetical protein
VPYLVGQVVFIAFDVLEDELGRRQEGILYIDSDLSRGLEEHKVVFASEGLSLSEADLTSKI